MTLIAKRAETIFKSDDPFFNAEAAQKSYELVMKMDEETAEFFMNAVVAETLWETIEKNQRTLQAHLDRVVEKRVERVIKSISSTYVAKRLSDENFDEEEALASAGAAALIAKAVRNPYAYGYQFDENKIKRNSSGQFTVKVKPMVSKPMSDRQARAAGIRGLNNDEYKKLSTAKKAQYQNEYLQISQALEAFGADSKTSITVQNRKTKRLEEIPVSQAKGAWDPTMENVVAIHSRPEGLRVGGASFDLVSSLGGSPERSYMAGQQMAAVDNNFKQFSDDWTSQNSKGQYSSTERLFGRVKSGSDFLSEVAPVGGRVQRAAAFGQFVGQHGPEAEKVIGPKARKTAYRYRGTEKTPEREVTAAFAAKTKPTQDPEHATRVRAAQSRAINTAIKRKATATNTPQDAVKLTTEERVKVLNDAKARVKGDTSPRAAGRFSARQEVANKLMDKAPSGNLYQLQLQSGHLPPSEGVIINRKGEITTQAVGYADDHYLPFNLKNLSSLKGGEYIRTRSVGGPTSEDMYTGLIGGAAALTVASRSGTFVVEFEPDFTGKRRYNDKAARMISRYEKLLDAVESGKVERNADVPPAIRDRIFAQVEEQNFGMGTSEMETAKRNAIKAYRQSPDLTEVDQAFITDQARKLVERDPSRNLGATERELRDTIREKKEFNFQLNGRGYEDALLALQEQFPYYIKSVRRIPRQADEARGASTRDLGYVKPRHNRPAAAKAGYFDDSINGGSKIDADTANYQNYGVRGGRTKSTEAAARSGDPDEKPSTVPTKNPNVEARKKVAQAVQRSSFAALAGEALAEIQQADLLDDKHPLHASKVSPEAFQEEMAARGETSPKHGEFKALMNNQIVGDLLGPQRKFKLEEASGNTGGEFNPSDAFHVGETPFKFSDKRAYTEDATTADIEQEIARLSVQKSVSKPGESITDLDEDELKAEMRALVKLRSDAKAMNDLKAEVPGRDMRSMMQSYGWDPSNDIVRSSVSSNSAPLIRAAENVQRARALKKAKPTDTVISHAPPTAAESKQVNNENSGFVHNLRQSIDGAYQRAAAEGDTTAMDDFANFRETLAYYDGKTISTADRDNLQSEGAQLFAQHDRKRWNA